MTSHYQDTDDRSAEMAMYLRLLEWLDEDEGEADGD